MKWLWLVVALVLASSAAYADGQLGAPKPKTPKGLHVQHVSANTPDFVPVPTPAPMHEEPAPIVGPAIVDEVAAPVTVAETPAPEVTPESPSQPDGLRIETPSKPERHMSFLLPTFAIIGALVFTYLVGKYGIMPVYRKIAALGAGAGSAISSLEARITALEAYVKPLQNPAPPMQPLNPPPTQPPPETTAPHT